MTANLYQVEVPEVLQKPHKPLHYTLALLN